MILTALAMNLDPQDSNNLPAAPTNYITQLCPASGCNDGGNHISKVLWVEMIMTFLFVSVVIVIVKHNGSQDMPVNAIAIGISLYTAIMIASGLSGGAINPAVALVQPVFQNFSMKPFTQMLLQLV